MIKNLPARLEPAQINKFDFGDPDAGSDNLLRADMCICLTAPLMEFLKGRKSLVIGDRGTGKSALFRLIRDGRVLFDVDSKQMILPVDEELQYKTISRQLTNIHTLLDDPVYKARIVWETFILYKVLLQLEKFSDRPHDLVTATRAFKNAFGAQKSGFSLGNLMPAITASVVIDGTRATLEPRVKLEPKTPRGLESQTREFPELDLDDIKNLVDEFLLRRRIVLFILIDKVDEFVPADEYAIQKIVLTGLLQTESSYRGYDNVKIRVFLRKDLFQKLDFSQIAFDKLRRRIIDLSWTDENIREFLAKRIWYNYFRVLRLNRLEMDVYGRDIQVDPAVVREATMGQHARRPAIAMVHDLITRLVPKGDSIDEQAARLVNLWDQIHRDVIVSIMPREIDHLNSDGIKERIPLFDFLSTHFVLGSGATTPRTVLAFLDACFDRVKEYLVANPDIEIKLDENNEYPLLKRGLIYRTYPEYQRETLENFSRFSSKWSVMFSLLAQHRQASELPYDDIVSVVSSEGQAEQIDEFIAYLTHIGYLECLNPQVPHDKRKYRLPVLIREPSKLS